MAAIMSDDEYDLFGRSNRRRCVKGRSAYVEQTDNSAQQEVKAPNTFSNSESYSHSVNNDFVDVDDVDEEAVTIDLSDFLNSNPLLAESLTENAVDSAASTESHSQFRVTTDSSQIVLKDLPLSPPKEDNVLECTVEPVSSEPIPTVVEAPPPASVCENGIDVSPKDTLIGTIQENVSIKENIINGATQSPKKQFKPKITGHTRPLKSSKNVLSRIRNFNKNNIRIFGKYPKVECEMLDIDQLVKNNEIKVGNWPYVPVVRKPKVSKNIDSMKKGNPLIIRPSPKLFNKPISFNRVVGTLNKARSILVDSLESKMFKTTKLQQPLNNLSKPSFVSGEKLIKIMHQNVTDATLNLQNQKFPMITSANKVMGSPKTFKLISPKTNIAAKSDKNICNFGTPILPKPTAEKSISPMMLKDFTVIQPYVDDPTSPIRPKPILTVPLDIVPTIEAVSQPTILHSSPVKSPQKPLKPTQSVFLNGGIQQISVPRKMGKLITPKFSKSSSPLSINENFAKPPISATSAVVDAMTSVFNKNSSKKAKPKQSTNKTSSIASSTSLPGLACNAYNSTLNDMLFGFDDFGDESFDVNNSIDDFSSEPCTSSTIFDATNGQTVKDIETPDIESKSMTETCSGVQIVNKDTPKSKVKRKKKIIEPIIDSDTWSASEGEIDAARVRMSVAVKKNQRKLSNISPSRKGRRSNSSHSRTLSQDSDSAVDRVCGSPVKAKKTSKQKGLNTEPPAESEVCLEEAEFASSIPISKHQDLERKDFDFEPSSNSNSRNLEETIDVCEFEDIGIVKTPKAKKETNNNVSESPKKSSTKGVKEKNSVNDEVSESIETEIAIISKSKSAAKQNSVKGKSKIVLTKGKKLQCQPKFQIKKKKVSKKLSANAIKKLSRPANIIKEINTITGAGMSSVKIKKGKAVSAEENHDNNQSDNITKSKSPKQKKVPSPKTKSKKNKTLQVLFKRPTRRSSLRSQSTQENDNILSDHDNECSSLSETSFNSTENEGLIGRVHSTEDETYGLETLASVSEMKSAEFVKEQNAHITSSGNVDANLTTPIINSEAMLAEVVSADDSLKEVNLKVKSNKSLITSESSSGTQLSASSNLSGSQDTLEKPFNSIADSPRKTKPDEHSNLKNVENRSVETIGNADSAEIPRSSENKVPEDSASSNNLVPSNTKDATLLNEVVSKESTEIYEPNVLSESSPNNIDVETKKAIDVNHDTSGRGLSSQSSSESELSEVSKIISDSKVENYLTSNTVSNVKIATISNTIVNAKVTDILENSVTKKRSRRKKVKSSDEADTPISDSKQEETSLSESKTHSEKNIDISQEKTQGKPKRTKASNPSDTLDSKQEGRLSGWKCNSPSENNNNLEEKKRGRPRKSKSLDQADSSALNFKPKQRLSLSELTTSIDNVRELDEKTGRPEKIKTVTETDTLNYDTKQLEMLSLSELSTSSENVKNTEKSHGRPERIKAVPGSNALNSESRHSERLSLSELNPSSVDTSEVKTRGNTKKIKVNTDAPDSRQEELTGSELKISSENIHNSEEKTHGRSKRIITLNQIDTPTPDLGQKNISATLELNTSSENISVSGNKRKHKNRMNLTSTPVSKKKTSLSMNISIVPNEHDSVMSEGETAPKSNQVSKSKKSNKNKSKSLSSPDAKNKSSDTSGSVSRNNTSQESNQIPDQDSITKIKTCPKVKISVAKNVCGKSRHRSYRNWYISERKPSTDSIPSDEITVLKPSERAELNRMKEVKSPNSRVRTETFDKEENIESTTFVTNAIVHVDATDIAADDEILAIDTHTRNQFIIRDLLNNIITSIEAKSNVEASKCTDTSIDLPVPLDKIKEEPLDEYEPGMTADLSIVKTEGLPSKAANKRKSIKNSWKMGRSPVCVLAEAIISTSKKKAAPKIKPKGSTPRTPPVSVQSAPPRIRLKNFSSEAVTIPFTQGWMRELVHRADSKPGKKMADVYYLSPEGKKLRSMVDVGNYLSQHPDIKLTLENFTYAKELVYRTPFEIERDAKQKSILQSIKTELSTSKTPKSSTPKITKFMNKAKASPAVTSTPKLQLAKTTKTIKKEVCTPLKETVSKASTESTITDTPITTSSGRQTKRKVPFDNSEPEPTPKRTRTSERHHSLSDAGSAPIVSLQASVPHSLSHEPTAKKTSETTKKIREPQLSQKNSENKPYPSSRPVVVKLPPQETKLPPPKRPKVQTGFNDALEHYIQPPCTSRCLVPKFQYPTIQCHLCLRFFHPKCVGSKTLKFACRPCALTKLAQYTTQKYPTINSFADIAYEETVFNFPEDFDVSLLVPEIFMSTQENHKPIPIPEASSKTFSISCTPIRFSSSDDNSTASPPSSFASKSPQLLSHLLDGNVPRPGSATQILSPEQLPKKPPFLLPANLKPTGNTKMYRVRLPAGADSVQLPNSLVIRRLPDRRIVVCSGAALQKDQSEANTKLNPSASHTSKMAPVASTSTKPSIPCKIKLASVPSLADRAHSVAESTSVQINSQDCVKRTDSQKQLSRLPTNVQCNNSLSNIRITSEKNPTKEVGEDVKKKLMGSVECLNLIFKRLNVHSLLRVSEVSRTWKYLARQNHLWKKVSFRGLQIKDWKKCSKFLHDRETEHLDLRGISHPNVFRPWMNLEKNVSMLNKIEELIVHQIPPYLLKAIISHLPQLRRLECNFVTTACTEPAIWKIPCDIELEPFRCLGRLVRLKIGSGGGIRLGSGPNFVMPYLPNLRHVALTGFDFHSHVNLEFLSQLNDLISLELGNISSIEPEVYPLLGTLTNLKSLRLENGGSIDEVKFSEALSKMKSLEVLELMNFKVSSGLANCLKNLTQLIHVNVWPDQTTEQAVINQNLLSALSNVKNPKYVCWGIIGEEETQLEVIHLRHPDSTETRELILEDLFKTLVQMFRECRVEVKCVSRKNWREFCSTRK